MKYQLEYHPNPNCLSIHMDKVLTNDMIEVFNSADWDKDKQSPLAVDLFKVEGITEVSFHRYTLGLTKGTVFEWDELMPRITLVLQMHLAAEEEMAEKAAPMRYVIDEKGYRQDLSPDTNEELHSSHLFAESDSSES